MNRAGMYMYPKSKIDLNKCKQQLFVVYLIFTDPLPIQPCTYVLTTDAYAGTVHILVHLTTSRFGNLMRLITLL